jgi:hypothetical protein
LQFAHGETPGILIALGKGNSWTV